MLGIEIVDDGGGSKSVDVGGDGEPMVHQVLADLLRDLGLEALNDLALVVEKWELGEGIKIDGITNSDDEAMDTLSIKVAAGGLEEHGLVKAALDVLGGVNEVLDKGMCEVEIQLGGLRVDSEGGEGVEGGVNGEQVGGDIVAGGSHDEDKVGELDEVMVDFANELPELFLLLIDLSSGGRL